MKRISYLAVWLVTAAALMWDRASGRRSGDEPDRGDVPGWVMVTVMSAILVVAILGIFEPQIKSALGGILDSIRGSNTN